MTVHELALLAGVSVRTLHHYDRIGLLVPGGRSDSGYRNYGRAEAERLQQILVLRELEFPLDEIGRILDSPDYDPENALQRQKALLQEKAARLRRVIRTIDKTLNQKKEKAMLSDKELYEGLSEEQIERWPREARERYDPAVVAESERRVRGMSKERWARVKKEGEELTLALAAAMNQEPASIAVQKLVARHHKHIGNFYDCTLEIYRGLASLYTDNPEFRAFYEKVKPGLAEFLRRAMEAYCERSGK